VISLSSLTTKNGAAFVTVEVEPLKGHQQMPPETPSITLSQRAGTPPKMTVSAGATATHAVRNYTLLQQIEKKKSGRISYTANLVLTLCVALVGSKH